MTRRAVSDSCEAATATPWFGLCCSATHHPKASLTRGPPSLHKSGGRRLPELFRVVYGGTWPCIMSHMIGTLHDLHAIGCIAQNTDTIRQHHEPT